MYVWSDEGQTQWVVHDGQSVISHTSGADLGLFYQSQKESQGKYDEVCQEFEGGERDRYGVKVGSVYITTVGSQLELVYQAGASEEHYGVIKDLVSRINKRNVQETLTNEERAELISKMVSHVPEEYFEVTENLLEDLQYQSDLHLVYDIIGILNKWIERDGFEGAIQYTEDGLLVDFGIEHPIVVHLGDYGRFSPHVDQTFITCIRDGDRLYNKVEQIFNVVLDFYKWLNPIDLSYQTNKVLGDDRIKVTLKDPRIIEYQRQIREYFNEFERECRDVKHIELVFSHTTRSVYANIEFFNNIPTMRLSVRDHDNCYEEGIHIIRVNTLKAKNVVSRLHETVGAYLQQQKQTKGVAT